MNETNKQPPSSSYRAFLRLFDLSGMNIAFQDDVSRILQLCEFVEDRGAHEYYLPPENEAKFKNMVKSLAVKYKLSALPFETIGDFIRDRLSIFQGVRNFSLAPDGQSIVYKIYPDTTSKDVLNDWLEIRKLQEKINGQKIKKNYPVKNYFRDYEIFRLNEEGKTNKEIAGKINAKYPNTTINYDDVSKIIARFIKRAR